MTDHFLAQYSQVWQQRRQHVTLIWAIPTIIFTVISLLMNVIFDKCNDKNIFNWTEVLFAIVTIGSGACGLLLRHNFFIKVLGLLLQDLDEKRIPLSLPQFGEEFRVIYRSKLNMWEKLGSVKDGTFWWLVTSVGLFFLLVALITNFTNSNVKIIFDFVIKARPWVLGSLIILFILELMQFDLETIE